MAAAGSKNGAAGSSAAASGDYDYDLLIIGCGVGGHGAALHAVECVSALPAVALCPLPAGRLPV